jgi:hypothetical protein
MRTMRVLKRLANGAALLWRALPRLRQERGVAAGVVGLY